MVRLRLTLQTLGATALLLCAACGAPPAPDPWSLLTVDTLAAKGDPAVTQPGAPLPLLSSPYAAGSVRQKDSNAGLTIFPAFSEGQTAAYMTTEVWQNFDAVWLQPLYVDLSGTNLAIFGVDATTRFYSPYWQIFFYTLPDGASFKSAKEVIDSGVPLAPGPGKYCSITNDPDIVAVQAEGAVGPVRPITGEPVGAPRNGTAWAAGNLVWFIDLGSSQRFNWNDQTLVVEETPLFAFARADSAGNAIPVDLPKVGGTGPRHAPRCDGRGSCSAVVNNVPEFGSLWRIWQILLPPGADVYVPDSMPELRQLVQAMGFAATRASTQLGKEYALRVAVNGLDTAKAKGCLASDVSTCRWLDSQTAIEANVADWRVTRTGTDVACPLVLFNGKALGP